MSLSFYHFLDACSQGSRLKLPGLRQMVNAHFFLELPVGVASPGWPLLDDQVRVTIRFPLNGLTGRSSHGTLTRPLQRHCLTLLMGMVSFSLYTCFLYAELLGESGARPEHTKEE